MSSGKNCSGYRSHVGRRLVCSLRKNFLRLTMPCRQMTKKKKQKIGVARVGRWYGSYYHKWNQRMTRGMSISV